jgi:hypothetical protein
MYMRNKTIFIENVSRFTPSPDGVSFTDSSETSFFIEMKDLVRLYGGSKFHLEKTVDWEKFCNGLFEKEK